MIINSPTITRTDGPGPHHCQVVRHGRGFSPPKKAALSLQQLSGRR